MKANRDVFLTKEPALLKASLGERISIGEVLVSESIAGDSDYHAWWDRFIDWDVINEELLRQSFDSPNNVHAEEYKRHDGFGGIMLGPYVPPSFEERVQSARDEMRSQLRKLKWFNDKVELLKSRVPPVPRPTHEMSSRARLDELLRKFHLVAKQLRKRHDGRDIMDIKDEYDVQDLLHALLRIFFDDIRTEEWNPSYAGGASRSDFLLKAESVVIEVKMTRKGLRSKELGEQLIIDKAKYKGHPDCKMLYCFVYDPEGYVDNPKGLEWDLSEKSGSPNVIVRIVPEGH